MKYNISDKNYYLYKEFVDNVLRLIKEYYCIITCENYKEIYEGEFEISKSHIKSKNVRIYDYSVFTLSFAEFNIIVSRRTLNSDESLPILLTNSSKISDFYLYLIRINKIELNVNQDEIKKIHDELIKTYHTKDEKTEIVNYFNNFIDILFHD